MNIDYTNRQLCEMRQRKKGTLSCEDEKWNARRTPGIKGPLIYTYHLQIATAITRDDGTGFRFGHR